MTGTWSREDLLRRGVLLCLCRGVVRGRRRIQRRVVLRVAPVAVVADAPRLQQQAQEVLWMRVVRDPAERPHLRRILGQARGVLVEGHDLDP